MSALYYVASESAVHSSHHEPPSLPAYGLLLTHADLIALSKNEKEALYHTVADLH
jgi:hypothetical protein